MPDTSLYGPRDTKLDALEAEVKTLREHFKDSFEYQYLNIVNLSRIRIAERILQDCLVEDQKDCSEMSKILRALDALGERTYKNIRNE